MSMGTVLDSVYSGINDWNITEIFLTYNIWKKNYYGFPNK